MTKRLRNWGILIALIGLGFAVYFEPTYCVRGWLHGEAFYNGRPTSYWRSIILTDLQFDPRRFVDPVLERPAMLDEIRDWIGYEPRWDISLFLIHDAEAGPVLQELMGDQDERVAAFADELWKMRRVGFADRTNEHDLLHWQKLVCKHNIKHKGFEKLLD